MMTRCDWETVGRARLEQAFSLDPVRSTEICLAVTGAEVFVWSRLTVRQVRQIAALAFTICLEGGST